VPIFKQAATAGTALHSQLWLAKRKDKQPMSIPEPNYTQIPNVLLDMAHEMGHAEFKVCLAIARQTFGWHKKRDKLSLSRLEALTGLSRQGVLNGLKAAIERGIVASEIDEQDSRGGVWYWLVIIEGETSQRSRPVNEVDQSSTLTRTSQVSRPKLVNEVDTQKKGNKFKKRSTTPLPPQTQPETVQAKSGGGGEKVTEKSTEEQLAYHPQSYQLLAEAGCVATARMKQAAQIPPQRLQQIIDTITSGGGGAGAIIKTALEELHNPELRIPHASNKPSRSTEVRKRYTRYDVANETA
jgi:phage replication O-like protein O